MWLIRVSVVLVYLFLISLVAGEFEFLQKTNADSSVKSANDIKYNYEQFKKIDNEIKKTNDTSSKEENSQRRKRETLDKPKKDQISLVIVFDNTGSMHDDLVELRKGAKEIIKVITNAPNNPVYDYVFVQFNDPSIGPILKTTDQIALMNALDKVQISGGGDCPELALKGLLKGLELALPKSKAFVFTDDTAKDFYLKDDVMKITQNKEITVSFLLTNIPSGECGRKSGSGYKAFEDIAKLSSGQVYDLGKKSVQEVVSAIHLILNRDATPIEINYSGPGNTTSEVHVDSTMKNMTVSLTGKELNINLTDPSKKEYKNYTEVINLDSVIMIKVDGPEAGIWEIRTYSTSNQSIIVRGFTNLRINYGFSFSDPETYEDTVRNPIENVGNVLSLFVEKNENLHNLTMVELELANPKVNESAVTYHLRKLDPSECDQVACLYVTAPFEPPHSSFKIRVRGFDSSGNPLKYFVSIDIKAIDGELLKPKVTIDLSKIEVEEGEKISIVCKVTSNEPPKVNWIIQDRLVRPDKEKRIFLNENSTFYYTINEASLEDTGKYRCAAKNAYGADYGDVNVFVQRIPLEVKMVKTKMVAKENDANFEIKCSITPIKRKVKINWQQNGKEVIDSEELQVLGSKLLFMRVNRKHSGVYTCIGRDGIETKKSDGHLNVLYPAEILGSLKENHTIIFDSKVTLNCTAIGNPTPKLVWSHENRTEVGNIIEKFTPENYGMYICEATNEVGEPSRKYVHLNSTTKGPPNLIHSEYYQRLKLDESITLKCGCNQCGPIYHFAWKHLVHPDSPKKPTILNGIGPIQDDRTKNFQYDLELKNVKASDDGYYICEIGNKYKIESAFNHVNVLEAPTIAELVPLEVKKSSEGVAKVNQGADVTLLCKAKGSPTPEVLWTKDKLQIVSKENSIANALILRNFNANDIGKYRCVARNSLGRVYKELQLYLTHPFLPINTIMTANEEQFVTIPCENQKLTFNNVQLNISDTRFSIVGKDLIFKAYYNDSGVYKCKTEDGSDTAETTLIVSAAPSVFPKDDDSKYIRSGEKVTLECRAEGFPFPKITWTFSGTKINKGPKSRPLKGGNLLLKNVTANMTGNYVCHASNKFGEVLRTTFVTVASAPNIITNFKSELTATRFERNFPQSCEATGEPKPDVFWEFQGERYATAVSQHILDVTFKMFPGEYTCVAKNSEGEDRKTVRISSLGPPKRSDSYVKRKVHVVEGQEFLFYCPFSNARTIVWSKNGMRLDTEPIAPLEVFFDPNASLEHSGNYTCLVENEAGYGNYTHELTVLPSNDLEKLRVGRRRFNEVAGKADETVALNCSTERGDIPRAINWIYNNQIISKNKILVLENIQLHDAGRYDCKDVEDFGYINESYIVTVLSPPKANMSKENWNVLKENETLELECLIFGNPTPRISWAKDDNPLSESTTTVLLIPFIKLNSKGIYKCVGENEYGRAEIIYHIDILEKPKLDFVTSNIIFDHTHDIQLRCDAHGNPRPLLVWSLKGEMLMGTSQIPAFATGSQNLDEFGSPSEIVPESSKNRFYGKGFVEGNKISLMLVMTGKDYKLPGTYTCHAINSIGKEEKDVKVDVISNEPPYLEGNDINKKAHNELNVLAGMPIVLSCPWIGKPKPNILWFKDNIQQNFKISASHDKRVLTLTNSTASDSGLYTCRANNKVGSKEKDFKVNVFAPSYFSLLKTESATESNALVLNCPIAESESYIVYWEEELHLGKPKSILPEKLTKLIPNHDENSAIYSCYTRSSAGVSEKKNEVQLIKTAPMQHHDTYKSINEGHTITLHCPIILKDPMPYIAWFQNGNPTVEIPSKISISENRMTFNVFNARKNDAGIYGCQTQGPVEKAESDITVKVRRRTEWSPWTPWSLCNKSCDKGTRIRTRQCVLLNGKPAEENDPPCDGEQFESQICNPFPCPIAGRWGEWKNWSPCSHSCWSSTKKSTKSRYRECNSPPPSAGGVLCIGSNIEKIECNVPHCPIDGGWSSYGDWSSCSVTCGNGVRSRHRRCDNPRPLYRGRNCLGERSETEACSIKPCPIDGGWSDWSKWSTCSHCIQKRVRTCNNPGPRYGGKRCAGRNYQKNSCC